MKVYQPPIFQLVSYTFREDNSAVKGKRDKIRTVPIPSHVLDLLKTWIDDVRGNEPGPLLRRYSNRGKILVQDGISTSGIYYVINTWQGMFELEAGMKVSPYDFRGAYASYLLEQGADISVVANLLGHADVKATKIYDRRGEKAKNVAVNLLEY